MLSARKKSLHPDDKKQLVEYLNKLKESEINLRKGFRIINEYSRLVYNLGENYDETLSLEKLQELTKNRDTKLLSVTKKQLKGLELLRSVADSVIDPESKE
jgi:hypothetical protein